VPDTLSGRAFILKYKPLVGRILHQKIRKVGLVRQKTRVGLEKKSPSGRVIDPLLGRGGYC